jgi:hypothetical protein
VTPTGPVHFVYLGGPFPWQYRRAVETAAVHGAPIWFWDATMTADEHLAQASGAATATATVAEQLLHAGVIDRGLRVHLPDWLRDHPIKLANVKDLYVWRILHEHGGLYLDLDTISLRPVWDLLAPGIDLVVSSEWEQGFYAGHPCNSAAVVARPGAPVTADLSERALTILEAGEDQWGSCGPHLLTKALEDWGDVIMAAPMPLLNGWRDDTIHRYYDGEPPDPRTRVIHCYQSSRPERFLADRWMPPSAVV